MEREILLGFYIFVWVLLLFFFIVNFGLTVPRIWTSLIDLSYVLILKIEINYFSLIFLLSLGLITITVGWFGELYVGTDYQKPLFWITLLGFVIGMAILIRSRDFLLLIVGWETLGITSYLLVAGYLSSLSSNGAIKTVLFNRIGDVFFVFVIRILSFKLRWIFFVIIVAFAICKSAQFPFSAWLPAAMAAPTPVSALVHSSTLVTAGLWVMLKMEIGGLIMVILGRITIIIGALCALAERDLKKVVAFSTLSQLGLLIILLSSFSFSEGFFHLITHAFFKSMLFIRIGYLILRRSHNQQGLFINGRRIAISIIAWVRLLRIRGLLFFGGFFSKHAAVTQLQCRNTSGFLFWILVFGSSLTCLYRARLGNSLLKLNKIRIFHTHQILLIRCVILGGAFIPKLLLFDVSYISKGFGLISFLFLFWLYWRWVLFGERELISSIFFSSLITNSNSKIRISPSILDVEIFNLRKIVAFPTKERAILLTVFIFFGLFYVLV